MVFAKPHILLQDDLAVCFGENIKTRVAMVS